MREDGILRLLSRSGTIVSCDEMIAELSELLSTLGFRNFAVLQRVRPDADVPEYYLAGSSRSNWLQVYSEKNYAAVDPVLHYLRKSQEPFRWRDAVEAFQHVPNFSKMNRMMQDAADHGLVDGYCFPVHSDRGLVGYLSMGDEEPRDLTPLQVSLLDVLTKKVFWQLLRICKPQVADALTAPVNIQLTRREIEVLSYLADGMTSNDIGAVLGISSNTVDWYMNGIQNKLEARNRHHAVAISFRLGLLS